MTETSKEVNLERVLCIRYPVRLRKDQDEVQALIDSGSEVNAVHPAYAAKLGLRVRETDVGAQKINGSHLNTFSMEEERIEAIRNWPEPKSVRDV